MSGDVDWVLLDRVDRAISLHLPAPTVPADARTAYATELMARGHTPNQAGLAVGLNPKRLRKPTISIGEAA